jgi:molybdate-binding protein
VRIEPGEHDVATRVAIGDADVGMLEAERFPRELVGAGGSVLELASKTAEGIGGHVIDSDEEDIGADFFGVSEWKKEERQDEEMFHGWGRVLLFKF